MASAPPQAAEVNSGFNLKHEFSKHNATVSVVIHNSTNGTYLSLDDRGVRIWDTLPGDGHGELKRTMFPKAERGFLSRVIYVPSVRLYFAAALDMTVKVYDGEFQLQQSVPSGQRSVLCLSFDAHSKELISAGIDGVKIWKFDRARLRNTGRRGPMQAKDYCLVERLRVDNFEQTLVSRSKLKEDARKAERENEFSTELMSETSLGRLRATGVPFTELFDTDYEEWLKTPEGERGVPPPKPVRVELSNLGTLQINDDTAFNEEARFHEERSASQKPVFLGSGDKGTLAWVFEVCRFDEFLFVVTGGAVVALDVESGQWLDTWDSMHEQSVTSVVYFPPRGFLLTSSNDCTVKVWSLNANLKPPVGDPFRQPGDETITLVKTFGEHKEAVKQIAIHPNISLELLVSCSHDCSVRVFHLGTLTEVYRLELGDPVAGIHISNDDSVAIFSGKKVSIWTLTQVYQHFAKCMSKPLAIHRVHPIESRLGNASPNKYGGDPWLAQKLQQESPAGVDGKGAVPKMPLGRRMRMNSQYDEWKADDSKKPKDGSKAEPQAASQPEPIAEGAAPAAAPEPAPPVLVPATPVPVSDLEPEAELEPQQTQCLTVVAAHSVRLLTADGQNVCSCILKDDGEVVSVCFDRNTSAASSHDHIEALVLTSVGTIWIYHLPTSGQHEEDILQDRKWLHTADLGVCCLSRLLCTSRVKKQVKSPPGAPQGSPNKNSAADVPTTDDPPEGSKFVLAGTDEGVVVVLNHEGSGKVVRTQKCHRWAIQQIEWLSNLSRVVTVCKDECGVWDDRALAPLRTISLGEDQSMMHGFTLIASNGMIVASDVEHHTIWTCDATGAGTHEHMDVLGTAHPDAVVSIDYNPDRDLFLTASIDGNVKVFAGASWAVLRDVKLGRTAQTACFLNRRGDIALGTGHSLSVIPASSAYVAQKTQTLRESVLGLGQRERTSKDPFKAVDDANKPSMATSIFSLTQDHLSQKIDLRGALLKEQKKEEKEAQKLRPRQASDFGLMTFPSKESVVLSTSTLDVVASPRLNAITRPVGLTPRGMSSGRMATTLRPAGGSGGRGRAPPLFSTSAMAMAPPSASFLRNAPDAADSRTSAQTLTGFLQNASWFEQAAASQPAQQPTATTVEEQARQPVIGADGRLPGREVAPRRSERHPGVGYVSF
jgi:WD40 repeat protein